MHEESVLIASDTTAENPFPGLRPFETDDAPLFFGRDEQIDELLGYMEQKRFVAVVGDSGSGKSSLVRAGLIPALQRDSLIEARPEWRIAAFRPGDVPTDNLANALDKSSRSAICADLEHSSVGLVEVGRQILKPDENLLLLVDQFEEIFRYKNKMQEQDGGDSAAAFVKLLLAAAEQDEVPIYVVLTMRYDFLSDCAQFPGLPEALNGGQYIVPRMTRMQQREAVAGPIAAGGATIAPRLVQRLLNDVGDNPDQLPILQHALMRTWEESRASRLGGEPIDIEHYDAVGGMDLTINRHLEEVYKEISPRNQETAKKIFQRLTEKSEIGRETRHPTKISDLIAVTGVKEANVIEVINKFRAQGRTFLTSPDGQDLNGDSFIDISHESLIRLWYRLRGWTSIEAANAIIYKRLTVSVAEQHALYRDPDLREAIQWKKISKPDRYWAERYDPAFDSAMDFLARSEHAAKQERRRRTIGWAGLCLFGIVTLLLVARLWWKYREEARDRDTASVLNMLAQAEALQQEQPSALETSTLLDLESIRISSSYSVLSDASLRAEQAIRQSLDLMRRPVAVEQWEGPVRGLAFSQDSRWLTVANDKALRKFGLGSAVEEPILPQLAGNAFTIHQAAFSADSRLVAIVTDDAARDEILKVFQLSTGKELIRLKHNKDIRSLAFSHDSRLVAVGSLDAARVVDTVTGRVMRLPHDFGALAIAFSPDGHRVVTGSWDGSARMFEVATKKQTTIVSHRRPVTAVAFSFDGRWIASGSSDGTVVILKAQSAQKIARIEHLGRVNALVFSRNGKWLAVASANRTARVFEVATSREVARLSYEAPVSAIAFSADDRLVAAGTAGTIQVFEVISKSHVPPFGFRNAVFTMSAVSSDMKRIATGSFDKTARVFTVDGEEIAEFRQSAAIRAVDLSADGSLLATGGDDHVARVFSLSNTAASRTANENEPIISKTLPGVISDLALSSDGHRLVVATEVATENGKDNKALVINTKTGEDVASFKLRDPQVNLAFSNDGQWLALGNDKTVQVLSIAERKTVLLESDPHISALAFSEDSRLIAVASQREQDSVATIFDRTAKFPAAPVASLRHLPRVTNLVFSHDSRWLATASYDGTVQIFEILTGREIVRINAVGRIGAMIFSTDGRLLYIASLGSSLAEDNFISIDSYWIREEDLEKEACSHLTSNLTQEDWKRYVQYLPYSRICSNLP